MRGAGFTLEGKMVNERASLKEIARLAGDFLERLSGDGVDRIFLGAPPPLPPRAVPPPGGPSRSAPAPRSASPSEAASSLRRIGRAVAGCAACGLGKTRNKAVFGAGAVRPPVVFIGEAPGAEEDRQGLPFVGRAGQLLTKMLAAIGFGREDVYITNIVKCRPPGNRDPRPDEVACCEPYLLEQLAILRPRLICALGRCAAQAMLKTDDGINRLRGRLHDYHGVPVLPTFHPAYLLRNPADKRKAWEDLKKVRAFADREAG